MGAAALGFSLELAIVGAFEALATVGGANFWNPVGWVCLALAVIVAIGLIYVYWDEIVAFVVAVGDGIASAWEWVIDTAETIWDSLTRAVSEKVEQVKTKLRDLAREIDETIEQLLKGYKVYQILMVVPGEYKKRIWGLGWGGKHFFPKDSGGNPTFKYGTTKNTVESRYTTGYIRDELFITRRLRYIYLAMNMNVLQARAMESSLILAYVIAHGTTPPGNSKFG